MKKQILYFAIFAAVIMSLFCGQMIWAAAIIADHTSTAEFDLIPSPVIQQIITDDNIFYGHTSHGSQLIAGMDMIYAESSLYAIPLITEYSDDLGGTGDTSWAPITRNAIDAQHENGYNIVIWSWCGGVSTNTEEGINAYLDKMNELEHDYPEITFIYMTGHLDGTGTEGNLYKCNNQIRDYCLAHDKVLFDFADIESYDPDGNYYPDETDSCGWCYGWCNLHVCPTCVSCAHSHCFNCYQKGKAFWWLLARITGWTPSADAENPDPNQPTAFSLSQNYPNPFNQGTVIRYSLQSESPVRITIYNLLGQQVRTLTNGKQLAGDHVATWDGCDENGKTLASGVYFYRLWTNKHIEAKKMVMMK